MLEQPADIVRSHFTFKQRNFDPETRQNRRREAGEDAEDTVEKAVEGLAEQIIQEDEAKRAEELVSVLYCSRGDHVVCWTFSVSAGKRFSRQAEGEESRADVMCRQQSLESLIRFEGEDVVASSHS
jgi:hypothetical protein